MPEMPPWLIDGRPDLWVRVGPFSKVIHRSPSMTLRYAKAGTLKEFGYRVYRDALGNYHFRISEAEKLALDRMSAKAPPAV